jgi:hypothetical protein
VTADLHLSNGGNCCRAAVPAEDELPRTTFNAEERKTLRMDLKAGVTWLRDLVVYRSDCAHEVVKQI